MHLNFQGEGVNHKIKITCERLKGSEIKNRVLDQNSLFYEIVFKDNGIGFPPEFAEQIFIIFQRLNDRNNYPGTGIGLALCEKIVQNHGGDIFAVSNENQGAEFHVILPVKNARKEEAKS